MIFGFPGDKIAAVHLQFWQGGHGQSSGHLCEDLSRCLHAPESVCALAMSPAHLDYSCTVVTSLSYPEILTSHKVIFLCIFYFQMVADNNLAQNYCTLISGDWNRSLSLVLWGLGGNLLLLAKIFSFFPLQWDCPPTPSEFHCCASQFGDFQMENIGKPEVVLPKQSAKNISTAKRQA